MNTMKRFCCLLVLSVMMVGWASFIPKPAAAEGEAEKQDPFGYLWSQEAMFTPAPTATPRPTPVPCTPTPEPTPTPTPKPASIVSGRTEGYSLIIDDQIDLLTDEEEKELARVMEPLTQYGTVAFVTTDREGSADDDALKYSREHIHPERSFNSVLFMIDMAPRTVYIFSRGDLERPLSRSVAYDITSNISHYATKGDYFGCAKEAYAQMQERLEGVYGYSALRIAGLAIISLAGGLLLAYLYQRGVNVQARPAPAEGTRRRNISLEVRKLAPGKTNIISITRRRKSKGGSSGSSCSSGGSSCSSGSSCGSGGGSSF